jgi:hypothetical protein
MTDQIERGILPIADPEVEGELPFDAKDPEAVFAPVGEDAHDADHFISADERFRVAMARQ